jgi:quercetin dioxygenase-like cupin family protein
MNKVNVFLLMFLISVLSFATGFIVHDTMKADLQSYIFKQANVKKSGGAWGNIYTYTSDTVSTYGTNSMLTAMLEFNPGQRLQPPHKHPEEEYQYVIQGSGTWFLNGVETTIKKGDLMYAKPWDLHGISNINGSDTLKFFVFKWLSKGMPKPVSSE